MKENKKNTIQKIKYNHCIFYKKK